MYKNPLSQYEHSILYSNYNIHALTFDIPTRYDRDSLGNHSSIKWLTWDSKSTRRSAILDT